jgi:hypothetical protein
VLRAQIVELTKERGAKLLLAGELKVSKQVLHAWLSGRSVPTAEHTLHLRELANPDEAQNQTPGSATNTAGSKQARKVSRETKPKPDPPRKK